MGWAAPFIEQLRAGRTVRFRPRGHSMTGRVNDGNICTVAPVSRELYVDDIVLCTVSGRDYLHLVKAIDSEGRLQIGNNKGGINGWIRAHSVHGILISREP